MLIQSNLETAMKWAVAIVLLFIGTGICVHVWEWLYPLLIRVPR